jgi:hypothetical protein
VTGSSGEIVAQAQVTLRNTQTNIVRTSTTNAEGIFVAALLPVGSYDVSARALGATEARRTGVVLRLGGTVELALQLGAIQLEAINVAAEALLVDPSRVESVTRLADDVVAALPNNGRNFLNLALLTPNAAIVQGPDGDELTVSGQRGIYNNISVDGADFNNPFFGEQRGGQRPAFTFNLDAVQEMVVVRDGANAEFGRSGGGFINVLTKSGTNELRGSLHYFGQNDAVSAGLKPCPTCAVQDPDFTQHQFGFTLGGPIRRDRAFFFIAYDQQLYNQTKQTDASRIDARLRTWMDAAFGGALRNDYGPIRRTNDANALLVKLDWRLSPVHSLSLKYNYTNSRQENGTFDVDAWARSANGIERDYSHAVNGSLVSLLSQSVTNEFRFQFAREYRPRPYGGPTFPGTSGDLWKTNGRPFPDTGVDLAGYRFGMPFFLPIDALDQRIQVLDNLSVVRGRHLFKVGVEFNRTNEDQTFIGFSDSRYIFGSVDGFLNYVSQGPTYVECSDSLGVQRGTSNTGSCAAYANTTISGPLLLFLQFAPVQPGTTVRDAGTQNLVQYELAGFIQDSWKPRPNLTVNYGLRWEAQIEPDPLTPPDQVFFRPFIDQTINGHAFPSTGRIPSDYKMIQPRLGLAWDVNGTGRQVLRANAGLYAARSPGLIFASTRTSNGSVGQTIFRASFFNAWGQTPPVYGPTLPALSATPDHPDVYVTDKNFQNPRTLALGASYERRLTDRLAVSLSYSFAKTTHLNRFINRNDTVFGSPFSDFPGASTNGIGQLWTLESTAKSQYHGLTVTLAGTVLGRTEIQANYTLSFDKSDDDNERDPFSFRYAKPNHLDREYNWSDRDQRHRFNLWVVQHLPYGFDLAHRVSATSQQPTSASCGPRAPNPYAPPAGQPATSPADRICANGDILLRNTLRKNNEYFQWDLRLSRAFRVGSGSLEAMVEVFNLTNRLNNRNPSAPALLFNFDGTIRSGLGDPRRMQAGMRWAF